MDMDKEYKLLKFRIIGAILFFSLVPLVTLGLFIHFQFNTTYQEKIKSNLSLIVENKKMELDMFFNERVAQLQSFANTHSYPDLSNSTRLAEMFKVMNTYTGSYIDLGIIGPDGNHVAYVGPYELGDVNYKHEVWFQKVMLKGLYISDVFMGFRQFPHFIIAIKCR